MEFLIHSKCRLHFVINIIVTIFPACWPGHADKAETSVSVSCSHILVFTELSHA